MEVQFAFRNRNGNVMLATPGSFAQGHLLGVIIDGSYHGELAEDVRAAIAKESVGSHWRGIRRRLGLSQRELAESVGCTQSAVAQWERRGNDPSHDIRQKILALL
jgi:DNA-binding XRE family transcriptional regulator